MGIDAYVSLNRTRPASVRKDMHTGRVFCFQHLVVYAGAVMTNYAKPALTYQQQIAHLRQSGMQVADAARAE